MPFGTRERGGNVEGGLCRANPERYGKLKVFYSTPTRYVDAVHAYNITWPVKTDDFFPYAPGARSFWTGYFTSRSALKRYIRWMLNRVHVNAQVLLSFAPSDAEKLEPVAVAHHHDGITGTEYNEVVWDYAQRMAEGMIVSDSPAVIALSKWNPAMFLDALTCDRANVSVCAATGPLAQSKGVPVAIYNPLPWHQSVPIAVPVPVSSVLVVTDTGGSVSQGVVDSDPLAAWLHPGDVWLPYTLRFTAELPPAGFGAYYIGLRPDDSPAAVPRAAPAGGSIENEFLKAMFSPTTGLLSELIDKESGDSIDIAAELAYYIPDGSDHYVFIPKANTPPVRFAEAPTPSSIDLRFVTSGGVQEARMTLEKKENITLTFRLLAGQRYLEVEAGIGPIDVTQDKSDQGKEVVLRFNTSIASSDVCFTDSNGREMLRRVRNERPTWHLNVTDPVSGNYYPVVAAARLEDEKSAITVLTDRAEGGASLSSGELELMVHRVIKKSTFGCCQPLNLHNRVNVVHWVLFSKPEKAASLHRPLQARVFGYPIPVFGTGKSSPPPPLPRPPRPILSKALPENVGLDVQPLNPNWAVLRLSHLFGVGEDANLSKPVTVDLPACLGPWAITSNVTEVSLTANQPLSDIHRLHWITAPTSSAAPPVYRDERGLQAVTNVTLGPLQIRSFVVGIRAV